VAKKISSPSGGGAVPGSSPLKAPMRIFRNNFVIFLSGFLFFLVVHQWFNTDTVNEAFSFGLQDELVPRKNTDYPEVENEIVLHVEEGTSSESADQIQNDNSDKTWLINEPDACKDEPEMLLGVAAAVYAFERREIIRQTWGTYAESENVKLLFFVGDNQDENTQESLMEESEVNHDIIQENYIESYWNLTRKTVGQMKWKKEFCNSTPYIAHLDDDVFIDVPAVLEQLRKDKRESWVSCMVKMGTAPVRRTGKYAVTKEEFAADRYPGACQGPCYFINDQANNKIVEESFKHQEFKLEDMFVTGVLRDEQSIPIWQLTDGSVLCQHLGKAALKNTGIKYAEKTVEERLLKAWKTFGPGGTKNL